MEMKRLIINNIGPISNVELELNKKLIVLKGDVRQGKTTILNSIGWLLGSKYPSNLITTGCQKGFIQLEYDDVIVRKDFYIKDGVTKNKKVYFKKGWDDAVAKPTDELKKILSPFVTDQDYFVKLTEPEKRRYLLELFNVDTNEIDTKLKAVADEYKINKKVLENLPEVVAVGESLNVQDLESEREAILRANEQTMEQFYTLKAKRQREALESAGELSRAEDQLSELRLQRERMAAEEASLLKTIDKGLTVYEELDPPITTNTEEITAKILEASKQEDNLETIKKRQEIESLVETLASEKRELVKAKANLLVEANSNHGIEGLLFNEDGSIFFEGVDSGYLSTSQLMRLSASLSSKYTDAISIETVDRAESLGESIISLVTKANIEKKTYLASVVGEFDAKNNDEIGVFLVKNGTIGAENEK